jgi:serine/threonine protein kinase
MPPDADPTIAGYPLLDDGTPFPGGQAFATSLPGGDAGVLRRYRGEWFAPADSLDGFYDRARSVIGFEHSNTAKVIDAGFVGSDVYVILEAFDGESLEVLVKDIGPMPTFMACEFARQAALGLQAAHDRGFIHGDMRPAHLFVGPLVETDKTRADGTPIRRPAPNAAVRLFDLGLIPKRPSGREWAAVDPLATKMLGFLPPERVEDGTTTVASDWYGLGATLFFLLTGRAPYVANSAEGVVDAIANTSPAPLATLRPDLPAGLIDVVSKLLSKSAAERPTNAAELLAPFTEPEMVSLTAAPSESPGGWTVSEYTGTADDLEHTYAPAAEGHLDAFATAHSEAAAEPKRDKKSKMTDVERTKLRMWLYMGGLFWFILVPILWFVLLSDSGCFKSDNGKSDSPTKKKK